MPDSGAGSSPECSSLSEPCRLRRSPQPPPHLSSCLVVVVILVVMLAGSTRALPTGPKPRWVNPCELPGHVFDPSTDMEGAPPIRAAEIFRNVRERAFVAKKHAEDVTQKFLEVESSSTRETNQVLPKGMKEVKTYFPDPDFIPGTSNYRQKWLPKIPPPREEDFKDMTDHEALLKSFEFLQFFAVGFEQIILDQTIHGGRFLAAFRDLENDLTQVLCELQLGLFSLRVPPSPDVLRDAMSQEYRDVQARTIRNIRDYMILRDFVSAADFVAQLFGYLERTL